MTVGIARRIAELYEIKVNALLDRAEDPGEVLDYSYAKQQELLSRIRRGIADVAAARKRAEMQESQLRRSASRLADQAGQAVAVGQDELARQALTLRSATLAHADDLRAEQAALRDDEERLSATAQRLLAKIEAFRFHKETIKAEYAAAQASAAAGARQAVGGILGEMGDVEMATRRAEDRTAQLQARVSALDELISSGALDDLTAPASDEQIHAQLDALTTQAAVDDELAKIRQRLASEAGQPTSEPPHGGRGPPAPAGHPTSPPRTARS